VNENFPASPAPGADDDALVERLRAADPAVDAAPDVVALRAAVDARIAAGQGGDQLAAARSRRWTSWPARVAAVAAAALVIGGGGGYAVGAAHDGGQQVAADAITLPAAGGQGGAVGAPEVAAGPKAAGGDTTSGGGARSSAAADSSYAGGYWGGHTVFTSKGLSGDAGTATAWAFDPSQAFTHDTAARLAAALGVTGDPVLQDGVWQLGPNDGTGPSLSVYPDGMASFNFYDPTKDPWFCSAASTPAPADTTKPSTDVAPGEPCAQRDLGPAVAGDAAVAAAKDVLTSMGVDLGGVELTAENWGDPTWTYVTGYQAVDGQRTGAQWNVAFTGAGMQSVSGPLAPLVSLGTYDVISPTDAVKRLTDPRFGSGYNGPLMYADGGKTVAGTATDEAVAPTQPTLPPTVAAGSSFSWPVTEVTIVKARLGLAVQNLPSGAAVLLPAYELTASDDSVWSVVAVADSGLDFSPVG
jgi:hypothetical protein